MRITNIEQYYMRIHVQTKNVSPLIPLRITRMNEILLTIHNYEYEITKRKKERK